MSDRLGTPPVEPMTNAAWARVERGLFERLDHLAEPTPVRRARWPYLAIPALAVAATVAIVVIVRDPAPPEVVAVPSPIVPSRVVAGDTPSTVSYGDAYLTVEAHAAIVMDREDRAPSVLVERGAVTFNVAPRAGAPYVVRAGDVVVRVVGTQFRVARYEEHVTVAVERGVVDVQFRGDVHRLSAGDAWSSREQTAQVEPTAPAPAQPASPTGSDDEGAAPPPPAPAGDATPPAKRPAKAPAPDTERATFERMASLEQSDPRTAIEGYLELAKGSSAWSSVALFSAGRLAFDRKDARARTFLQIYLRRFPSGTNAKDARDLLSRLDGATP